MYKTCPYYFNTPMYSLSPCDICKMYSCPYCINTPLHNSNFSRQLTSCASDDDFVIVYGINHDRTGKAIYSNASSYGAELFNGVAGAFSTVQFPDTAVEYFPEWYENAKYYYIYKMARKADEDDVVIIPYSTGNPLGKAYGVDNNQDARIVFRVYLDKTAMVGPYIFDIIWDRVILFTKKKT